MELKDTYELMTSVDYRKRFKAEYLQTKIRYEKLKAFNNRIEASQYSDIVKEPIHDCPFSILKEQQSAMGNLLRIYEIRAVIEDIDLGTNQLTRNS